MFVQLYNTTFYTMQIGKAVNSQVVSLMSAVELIERAAPFFCLDITFMLACFEISAGFVVISLAAAPCYKR